MKRGILLLLFGVLLGGCGAQPASQPTVEIQAPAPPGPASTSAATAPPAAPALRDYPTDPQSVVQSFLTSLQIDTSGQHSLKYLAPDLQSQIQDGTPVAQLLGVQHIYEWFTVQPASIKPADAAHTQATLYFSDDGVERFFDLRLQDVGIWQIASIHTTLTNPPSGQLDYPAEPTQVVQRFLQALSVDADAALYLSDELRQQVQAGTPLPALVGIQNMPRSFNVREISSSPDAALIEVRLHFAAGDESRTFEVSQTSGQWQIVQITP